MEQNDESYAAAETKQKLIYGFLVHEGNLFQRVAHCSNLYWRVSEQSIYCHEMWDLRNAPAIQTAQLSPKTMPGSRKRKLVVLNEEPYLD